MSSTPPTAIVVTLDVLGYRSITDEIVARKVSDAVHVVFDRLGKNVTLLVVDNLCKISRLAEQQLFHHCDLVEESVGKMFASAAEFLIDRIKDELLPFSITKNPIFRWTR